MLSTARRLAVASRSKPRQSDLRRAVSSAYYALFHAIAKDVADVLVGVGHDRPDNAWRQAYRALDHGPAKTACEQLRSLNFPPRLQDCGDAFVEFQLARHRADYDPAHRLQRAEALAAVARAEEAIGQLKSCRRKDRKAFAVLLLLKRR
jgi:uncharacterized protein (UPF0332 family)